MIAPGKAFFQMCWHVPDIHAAMRRWHQIHGIGPFFYVEHLPVEYFAYRGKPASVDISMAIVQMGSIQIELLQQHDDQPSAFRDMYARSEEGVHHMATLVPDYTGTVDYYRAQGFEVAQAGTSVGINFTYMDARKVFGCMIEIIEESPIMLENRRLVAEAAANWDGKDPFRKKG